MSANGMTAVWKCWGCFTWNHPAKTKCAHCDHEKKNGEKDRTEIVSVNRGSWIIRGPH